MGILENPRINIIKNPGFEEDRLAHWEYDPLYTRQTTRYRLSGAHSCESIAYVPEVETYLSQGLFLCTPYMPIYLSFWVLTPGDPGLLYAMIYYYTCDNISWYRQVWEFRTKKGIWTPCQLTTTAHYTAASFRIEFRLQPYNPIYIDDVFVPATVYPRVDPYNVLWTRPSPP